MTGRDRPGPLTLACRVVHDEGNGVVRRRARRPVPNGVMSGALDLTRLRFEEAGEAVPTTVPPLPDEPRALGFA